jgi:dystonin
MHFILSRHVSSSLQFFSECHKAEEWMKQTEENLNLHFTQSDFTLDEGENLLKEMQQLRDKLSQYEDEVERLFKSAGEIVPLRARGERLKQPVEAVAICQFQSTEASLTK